MGRPAHTYRGARRNRARRLRQIWQALQRVRLGDGSLYVPPPSTHDLGTAGAG